MHPNSNIQTEASVTFIIRGLYYLVNDKSQAPNNKKIAMTKIQDPKLVVSVIGYWNL
jgi:hypothetical protein